MFRHTPSNQKPRKRLGAAAVEMAMVLPLFMTVTFGSIEIGHALNVSQKLSAVVRDGGRLASKDVDPALLAGGITANQKVINDIKNMLKAEGYNTTNVIVTITYADGANVGQPFDISLSTNQYKLMRIRLTVPYSDVGIFPMKISSSALLDAELVTAKGRATMNL
ncbi:MAG: pilus assembly protein [Planctomycetota bacterium]|jgi:Flp pilus assembly protein TadG|nr:MAG: pilus assembly protein [Planctomycetota bacterium]